MTTKLTRRSYDAWLFDDKPLQLGQPGFVIASLADLRNGRQQRTFLDAGRGLPGVDALLDPDRDGHGADTDAFPAEVGDHPAVLSLVHLLDGERGQFPPPQAIDRWLLKFRWNGSSLRLGEVWCGSGLRESQYARLKRPSKKAAERRLIRTFEMR